MTDSTSRMVPAGSTLTRYFLLLMLVASFLFFAWLNGLPLLEPDEGRNAEVAREMLITGDWITPHFNTLTYLDKPPLFFWLVATSFRVWGVSEWAARLPSALMALATLALTWLLARRMFGSITGLQSGIILATSPLVLALSHLVSFDMTLTFFVTLAMVSFWLAGAREAPAYRLDALMFGAMGLATITKGPIGFLLPLVSILAFLALLSRLRELKRLHWGLGTAVFLAVTLPWLIAVSFHRPDFLRYALWYESLERFASAHTHRSGSFAYYVPVYLAGFFPWSIFLLFVGLNLWKRWRKLRDEAQRPVLFLLVWAGVILFFFTISRSKLPAYFLPAVIPLSILMARAWSKVGLEDGGHAPDWLSAGFATMIALGLLVAFASRFSSLGAMQARLVSKFHPSFIAGLKPSVLFSGLILIALAIIGRNLAKRMRGVRLAAMTFLLAALTTPFLVVRWITPLKTYASTVSSRRLAQAVLASPEKDLPLYGYYYFRTSLPFYLRRPVGLVTSDGSETTSHYVSSHLSELRRHVEWSGRSAGREELARALASPVLIDIADLGALTSQQAVLVLARNAHVPDLAKLFSQVEPLWAGWEYSVWKIPSKSRTEN